jgi:predicted transcriptional regulator
MSAEKLLNVRLPAELHGKLERLTKATGRTKSFLTVEALKGYVEAEAWQVQDQGEFASPEEVTAFFAKHGC